jgi:hypothetical protein
LKKCSIIPIPKNIKPNKYGFALYKKYDFKNAEIEVKRQTPIIRQMKFLSKEVLSWNKMPARKQTARMRSGCLFN